MKAPISLILSLAISVSSTGFAQEPTTTNEASGLSQAITVDETIAAFRAMTSEERTDFMSKAQNALMILKEDSLSLAEQLKKAQNNREIVVITGGPAILLGSLGGAWGAVTLRNAVPSRNLSVRSVRLMHHASLGVVVATAAFFLAGQYIYGVALNTTSEQRDALSKANKNLLKKIAQEERTLVLLATIANN